MKTSKIYKYKTTYKRKNKTRKYIKKNNYVKKGGFIETSIGINGLNIFKCSGRLRYNSDTGKFERETCYGIPPFQVCRIPSKVEKYNNIDKK